MHSNLIDFERSRLSWLTKNGSHGHWRLIARAINGMTGEYFVLTAKVMAGNVYSMQSLLADPPYFYQMVGSIDRHVIFRDFPGGAPKSDSAADHHETFSEFEIILSSLKYRQVDVTALAADRPWPLIAQLNIIGRDGVNWLLDFPINHVNHRNNAGRPEFQVETGPILIPVGLIDSQGVAVTCGFTLAYIFFNRLDYAELALWTPLMMGGASGRAFRGLYRLRAGIEVHTPG